ncbi:Sm-like protein lsm7 [Beauveria asiatica]|uniref:Sm-like protein lsm7 n=1 Tax=Beauveria asiatica TaxID=1069075 RepID=A0AAW0S633_9HYPO
MSERPAHRGGRGGRGDGGYHRGGGGRGGSSRGGGGDRGGHRSAGSGEGGEKPKKENILDLTKYMDKQITVKFNGGREGAQLCERSLSKGDASTNSVGGRSDGHAQGIRRIDEPSPRRRARNRTRPLGLVVARGTLLVLISPLDGSEEIANPFAQPDDE